MNAARGALAAAAGLCLLQALRAYQMLPNTVASHFGPSGHPDSYAPKTAFLGLYAGVVLFLSLMMVMTARSIGAQPDTRINLPNKDYWLAPGRRQATIDAIGTYMAWFGAATNLLLFDVFGQAIRVNLRLSERLDHPKVSLGVYLAFALVWTVAFTRRFAKTGGG